MIIRGGVAAGDYHVDDSDSATAAASDPKTVIFHISGAFFFGAASTAGTVLDRIADQRRNFILDCSAVPFLDSTAASVIDAPGPSEPSTPSGRPLAISAICSRLPSAETTSPLQDTDSLERPVL